MEETLQSNEVQPVPIRLKLKYRRGFTGPHKSSGNRTGVKHRNKLSSTAKARLPSVPECVKVMNVKTGAMRVIKTGRMLKHTGTQLKVAE